MKLSHKILLIFIFISFFSQNLFSQNGVFDFRNKNFDQVYSLSGNWEFYWKELLTPSDISKLNGEKKQFIHVNGVWDNFVYNGKKIGGEGYATYHTKIIVPHTGSYCLKLHQILSSYKIWINGELKDQVGIVASNKKDYTPKVEVNEINFHTSSDTVDIVIQVANFSHKSGGIQEIVEFGKPNVIITSTNRRLLYTFFILGAELMFALYFFFSFFYRQKDLSYIFFSIAIILAITFELVNNEMILVRFIPSMSFEVQKKIDFFSNYARWIFFTLFLWMSFKEYKIVKSFWFKLIFAVSVLYTLSVLIFPCRIYSKTLYSFMVVGIASFIYFTYVATKAVFKKVPYVIYSFIGILILTVAAINDALYGLNILNTGYWLNTGLLFFFMGHSITLSLKYSMSSQNISELSGKFKRYEKLLAEFLTVYSYELDRILDILQIDLNIDYLELLMNNGIFSCECMKNENYIVCGKLEKTLKSKIDKYLLEELKNKKEITVTNRNNINIATVPIIDGDKIKAILYLERHKNFSKTILDILEMIMPQLSTFIDNYQYYYNLENLNANLEHIIQKRTEQVYKQKEELVKKSIELSEKVEELNITSGVIDELNEELNNQKRILGQKNKQLELYKQQINHQKNLIEEKQKYIKESIHYAVKIQKILFSHSYYFPFIEYFVFSSPRSIISGDLLVAYEYNDIWVEIVADTTGRDVSASFLTLFIHSLFEDFVHDTPELLEKPDELIDFLRYQFIKNLDLNTKSNVIEDSFDIAILSINKTAGEMKYAGARCGGLIVSEDRTVILESDNITIGGHISNYDKKLTVTKLNLHPGDNVYLFTDGYYKQIGEKTKKKFGMQSFLGLLKEISVYPMAKQQEILIDILAKWKGNIKRVDDILITGFRYLLPQKNND